MADINKDNNNTECDAGRERQIYRVTLMGSVINAVLVVFKFVAGILGH